MVVLEVVARKQDEILLSVCLEQNSLLLNRATDIGELTTCSPYMLTRANWAD